ncbi:hypothetical protein CTA2_11174 [Colletotrichum tanaceti]|uniref:Uncharacterized protein n=1 Tax=Colletotrichum tanaceti TaxID=1306861 RepID=A0A4U6X1D4_9PEZI|nr:hypothetical protein CTA2_11174 [Colletotrichum tanaceti]TKW49171.1 hypothetical protein CTA1_10172 [Colletotrichum tanaceti]
MLFKQTASAVPNIINFSTFSSSFRSTWSTSSASVPARFSRCCSSSLLQLKRRTPPLRTSIAPRLTPRIPGLWLINLESCCRPLSHLTCLKPSFRPWIFSCSVVCLRPKARRTRRTNPLPRKNSRNNRRINRRINKSLGPIALLPPPSSSEGRNRFISATPPPTNNSSASARLRRMVVRRNVIGWIPAIPARRPRTLDGWHSVPALRLKTREQDVATC